MGMTMIIGFATAHDGVAGNAFADNYTSGDSTECPVEAQSEGERDHPCLALRIVTTEADVAQAPAVAVRR